MKSTQWLILQKNLEKSGDFADDALVLVALEEAVVAVGQEVVPEQRSVDQSLDNAAHEASVA